MSDFITLVQTVGIPLAITLTVSAVLARFVVVILRDKDRVNEARVQELKDSYEARIQELQDDRDWHRDRVYQFMGLAENQNITVEELVKRVARQLPPGGRGRT